MQDPQEAGSGRDRKIECPECGVLLSPRGMAGHRRLKHGVASTPKVAPEEGLVGVRAALEAITGALDRIDRRMTQLEGEVPQRSADQGREIDELRKELDAIVSEIARAKASYKALGHAEGATDREEYKKELGRLRRRQAVLLFRMGSEAPGVDPTTADSGWGIF